MIKNRSLNVRRCDKINQRLSEAVSFFNMPQCVPNLKPKLTVFKPFFYFIPQQTN
jgi:hypothetical protein